jgi:hypothetical protein
MEFIASQKKRLLGSRCKKLTTQIIGVGTPCHLAEVRVILVLFLVLRNVAKGRTAAINKAAASITKGKVIYL